MFELSWEAPEGKVAKADLDGLYVSTNDPVICRTWWFASVLAARIILGTSEVSQEVADLAARIEVVLGEEPREFDGWKFWISEEFK